MQRKRRAAARNCNDILRRLKLPSEDILDDGTQSEVEDYFRERELYEQFATTIIQREFPIPMEGTIEDSFNVVNCRFRINQCKSMGGKEPKLFS